MPRGRIAKKASAKVARDCNVHTRCAVAERVVRGFREEQHRALEHQHGGGAVDVEIEELDAWCRSGLANRHAATRQVTVVSAMQGVTDALIALGDAALTGSDWRPRFEALRDKHLDTVQDLGGFDSGQTHAWLVARFEELAALLGAIALLGPGGEAALARVHGLGEVWSAHLLAAALAAQGASSTVLDAREVLVVGRNELGVAVDWAASAARLATWREAHPHPRVVVTGFVARDVQGTPTTLGPQRQRFFRRDLRGAVRSRRTAHLDRRRRRAFSRSARRAGSGAAGAHEL
jgi:hypothetical protein